MNLEVKDLEVKIQGKKILDNINLEFKEGEITVILGPNGCGKTTLIKEIVKKYADTKELAYVAQETTGYLNLEVRDVVELARYDKKKYFAGLSKADKDAVESALKEMRIEVKENQLFDTLSGGEKQCVMMARALAQGANWLILDEPTSNLDAAHVRRITDAIKNHGQAIVVMHDINEALRLGNTFVLMKEGKVLSKTSTLTEELLEQTFDARFSKTVTSDELTIFYLKQKQE